MAPASPHDSAPVKSTGAKLAGAWRNRAISLKAVSFGMIGIVNSLVDYGVFLTTRAAFARLSVALAVFAWLSDSCHCGRPETLLLVAANMTSWLVAVTGSYVMNSSITFAHELRWRAYAAFVVSSIAGWFANTATLLVAAELFFLPVWPWRALW